LGQLIRGIGLIDLMRFRKVGRPGRDYKMLIKGLREIRG